MENIIILQKWQKKQDNEYVLAEKYYTLLSAMNSLQLTEREIQLVAFTAIKGNISNANVRTEFINKHDTSSPTINNMISKLKKINIFIKENGKVKVNPRIVLDFKKNITINISLQHVQTEI